MSHVRRQPAVASQFGAAGDSGNGSGTTLGSSTRRCSGFASSAGNSRCQQDDRGQVQEQSHYEHAGDLHQGQGLRQVDPRAHRRPFSNEYEDVEGQRCEQEGEAGDAACGSNGGNGGI